LSIDKRIDQEKKRKKEGILEAGKRTEEKMEDFLWHLCTSNA
jgi:hypothetical protein